jgi:hypothetical protein
MFSKLKKEVVYEIDVYSYNSMAKEKIPQNWLKATLSL